MPKRPLGRKPKNYGAQRAKQIARQRAYEKKILRIIRRDGPQTALGLELKHGIPRLTANIILSDLERRGLHMPPIERARAYGPRELATIQRRVTLKHLIDMGTQMEDMRAQIPDYSLAEGEDILAADMRALKKYEDKALSLHIEAPVNPRVKKISELLQQTPTLSNDALAQKLGVSERTIRDDLTLVPKRIKDKRILPGQKFSIEDLRRINNIVRAEAKKGTRIDVIIDIIKSKTELDVTRADVASQLTKEGKKDVTLKSSRFGTGPTKFTREQLSLQNGIIIGEAKQGKKPAAIRDEIKRTLNHELTTDQIDARMRWFRKKGKL